MYKGVIWASRGSGILKIKALPFGAAGKAAAYLWVPGPQQPFQQPSAWLSFLIFAARPSLGLCLLGAAFAILGSRTFMAGWVAVYITDVTRIIKSAIRVVAQVSSSGKSPLVSHLA